jgi:hypothetical protein
VPQSQLLLLCCPVVVCRWWFALLPPSPPLQLLRRGLPALLEQAKATVRAHACLLIGKCELLLGAPGSRTRAKRAVVWLERSRQDWEALDALPLWRETLYLLVSHCTHSTVLSRPDSCLR